MKKRTDFLNNAARWQGLPADGTLQALLTSPLGRTALEKVTGQSGTVPSVVPGYGPQTWQSPGDPVPAAGTLSSRDMAIIMLNKLTDSTAPIAKSDGTQLSPHRIYNAYLETLDELDVAIKSGMTAREYAMSKDVPSSLSDEDAAILDEYEMAMRMEDEGNALDRPKLLYSGNQLDKGGELTKAGRALEKHGSRYGSIYPQSTGNVANKNSLGKQTLESILNNPNAISVTRYHAMYGNILEVKIPGGMGARFSADGSIFIGFLE